MGATQSVVPVVANKHYESVMASIPYSAFAGSTVAITGCSSGVGKEAALPAAERGAARICMLIRASERASAAENAVRAKRSEIESRASSSTVYELRADSQRTGFGGPGGPETRTIAS
jgi:NADPH:quinone reductase-like Zn-dependent oxidoreductase